MKILKNISIFFLLVVLTCCVVFGPQLISGQGEDKILDETVYRSYNTSSRPKPTSKQVAQLYYDREINFYNSSPVNSEKSEVEAIQKTVVGLVEMMFGEDKTVCDLLKTFLTDGNTSYSRNNCLIKIDGQPTALNFVNYSVINDGSFFEILYEEKTETIIRLSYDAFTEEFADTNDRDIYREKTVAMMKNYFENQLDLVGGQYFFTADLLEDETDESLVNIIFGCEIMQFEDGVMEE